MAVYRHNEMAAVTYTKLRFLKKGNTSYVTLCYLVFTTIGTSRKYVGSKSTNQFKIENIILHTKGKAKQQNCKQQYFSNTALDSVL